MLLTLSATECIITVLVFQVFWLLYFQLLIPDSRLLVHDLWLFDSIPDFRLLIPESWWPCPHSFLLSISSIIAYTKSRNVSTVTSHLLHALVHTQFKNLFSKFSHIFQSIYISVVVVRVYMCRLRKKLLFRVSMLSWGSLLVAIAIHKTVFKPSSLLFEGIN